MDFAKIDRSVDLKGLQADVEEAKKNGGGDFPTIPAGKYEVRPTAPCWPCLSRF